MVRQSILRRHGWRVALVLGLLAGPFGLSLALGQRGNEKHIEPGVSALDPGEINKPDKDGESKLWVLDFRFKPLRTIKVNVPGRGERVCLYLWYQVINKTGKPRTVVPNIVLVDALRGKVYPDEILPSVQKAIADIEDPDHVTRKADDWRNIRNSVTILREPIPPQLPNAVPRPITGVAIWCEPEEPTDKDDAETRKLKLEQMERQPRLADLTSFSICISGLSNGIAESDDPSGQKKVLRRKTLQLNFLRKGDATLWRDRDVRFEGHEWIYRASLSLDK